MNNLRIVKHTEDLEKGITGIQGLPSKPDLINVFIYKDKNPKANFSLAIYYFSIKHYAGAVCHFLRCAEYADIEKDKNLIYECLLHTANCFFILKNRDFTTEGFLLHAIAFNPKRPEAYWFLSQVYERNNKRQESLAMIEIAITHANNSISLLLDIGFNDNYVLYIQKAVALWWVGRFAESRKMFFEAPNKFKMNDYYLDLVQTNITKLGLGEYPFLTYTIQKQSRIKQTFIGIEKIKLNQSQVYQDMFVLTMLNGKENGFYLEIGSADPIKGNNTFILEYLFNWKGISIDFNEAEIEKFVKVRKNKAICKNAITINYETLLSGIEAPETIDYLQLDCDPPKSTYNTLLAIPFEKYKFAVITYEHDFYADARKMYRELSRKYLQSFGYVLIVNDISADGKNSFEDWWVHPDLVKPEIIQKMMCVNDKVKNAENYMLND